MTIPADLSTRLQRIARTLDDSFLGKSEIVRAMLVAVLAGEHVLLLGPPGTAKSAIVRTFSRLIDAKYFEYLLTRFTEPNEIFGPIDITAFRDGSYKRRMEGMLPEAEIVFLDEVFKANSAILNSLLGLLNERLYTTGGSVHKTPLLSAFGASNEVPKEEELLAVFDRFLLRVVSDNLDGYHFLELLQRGIAHEAGKHRGSAVTPVLSAADLRAVHQDFASRMRFTDDFLSTYKSLVFQIRAEGISLSDRRAVKMLKLFAASAMLDGRATPDARDFSLLRHAWNSEDQRELLEGIVGPVLETFFREHPAERPVGATGVGVEGLLAELERIRVLFTSGTAMSDVQLFSQLKALGEIKGALESIGTPNARAGIQRVDELLGHVFKTGKFA